MADGAAISFNIRPKYWANWNFYLMMLDENLTDDQSYYNLSWSGDGSNPSILIQKYHSKPQMSNSWIGVRIKFRGSPKSLWFILCIMNVRRSIRNTFGLLLVADQVIMKKIILEYLWERYTSVNNLRAIHPTTFFFGIAIIPMVQTISVCTRVMNWPTLPSIEPCL